ncbi:pogo transposable element with ZNF domain [Clarias magur]|uniref:Pogo transposable element with ZNF domain n=1 Tax=Clarias magur TaxID=1594786 RepID=A0A8J4UWT1_CLAMG|nr:pogo transposable element with ZNF domain [Clarias magur]
MAESEFYMQCEEEELAPCQNNTGETNPTGTTDHAHNGHAVSPEPSASPVPAVQPPAIKTAFVQIAPGTFPGPVVPQPILAGVLQIAAAGAQGQPIYLAPKPAGSQQNAATTVGLILPTGQAVTFLTPSQPGPLINPQIVSTSSLSQPTTIKIPVSIIHNPSAVQAISTVTSSGMPAVGTSPAASLPNIAQTELPSTSSSPLPPPDAAQAHNLLTDAAGNVLDVGQSKTPSQVSSVKTRARTRKNAFSAIVSPRVFQNVFKAPQSCSHCGVAYKVVQELRGYMCVSLIPHTLYTSYLILFVFLPPINPQQVAVLLPPDCPECVQQHSTEALHCNPELINRVHALGTRTKKRAKRAKRSSDSTQSVPSTHNRTNSPSSSSTSASSRHPAASPPPPPPPPPPAPCLKHITTSEIPEGVQSPGTGDYDSHGKLIILVEDFYYGRDPGNPVLVENNQVPTMMKCHLCDKKLKNNIK